LPDGRAERNFSRRCVAPRAENPPRQKAEFASRIKLIWAIQPAHEK
jgi:hypothetical protein